MYARIMQVARAHVHLLSEGRNEVEKKLPDRRNVLQHAFMKLNYKSLAKFMLLYCTTVIFTYLS
jgi:hypothetical protein